jgi:IclR family transcriptional regulator, acetate operon repressor
MAIGDGTASLDKALSVLDLIGAAPNGMNNVDLLKETSLPKTTLYRILATLVERGLVRRDQLHRVYRLGFRYLELVRNAYLMPDLVAAASVELRALRDLTGETAYLAVLDGVSVLSLERCDGAHSHRSSAALGQSKPLHCTGQGKSILSRLPKDEAEALIRAIELTPLTEYTITDRRRLQVELGITAARGYAIDDEEIVLGVRCVAAPIVDAAGNVRGALSVAGPAYRLTRTRLELLGPEVAEAARRVGSQLAISRQVSGTEQIEPISEQWAFHGAHPVWDAKRQVLFWADTLAPAVRCFDGTTDRLFARVDSPITAMDVSGDKVIVAFGGQHHWLDEGGQLHQFAERSAWRDPAVRLLCVDREGQHWATLTRDATEVAIGVINQKGRFEARWHASEPIDAMRWCEDGTTAYAIAPDSGTVYLVRKDVAQLRRFAQMPKGSGRLSGIAIDAAGGAWIALGEGWSAVRFAEDGTVDRIVSLPVAVPTGLAVLYKNEDPFLYVTSDRHLQTLESLTTAPWSGRLLQVRL